MTNTIEALTHSQLVTGVTEGVEIFTGFFLSRVYRQIGYSIYYFITLGHATTQTMVILMNDRTNAGSRSMKMKARTITVILQVISIVRLLLISGHQGKSQNRVQKYYF